jgi:predicted aconitase with swiveling domain
MAKKTYKGRPILPGELTGKALVSREPFNTTVSYLNNMFAGVTDKAICTDSDNHELYQTDLNGMICCTPQTIGSTLGGCALMGVAELGVGPKAMLFSEHIDSLSASGLLMEDIWNDKRIITIDQLGEEFMAGVNTGDPIAIHEDGTVEVG